MPVQLSCLRQHTTVLLLGLGSAILCLTNLQHSMLWYDEAQTAVISRTVLTNGIPLGTDGRNFFSAEEGAEYAPGYVWRWHTWLPFYLLAAFFGLFGENTFIARLPFALCGVASIIATYHLANAIWRDRRATIAAGVLLALSVPFLILTRQCRYYSMTALFTVLALHGYWRLMGTKRFSGAWLIIATLLLFHTHYVYVLTLVLAVTVHALIWHRDRFAALCGTLVTAGLLCVPWVVWFAEMQYSQKYGHKLFIPALAWSNLKAFIMQLEAHSLPALVLEVSFAVLIVHGCRGTIRECLDRELWRGFSLLLLVAGSNLAVLSLLVPAPFFRYVTLILPLVSLVLGRLAIAVMRWHWSFGVLFLLALIGREPLADYAYELTHDFNGPVEGIVSYLNAHAREEDVLGITSNDLPSKFYTRLRVIGGCTGEDLAPAQGADWIIISRHTCSPYEIPVRNFLTDQLQQHAYEKIVLDSPDTMWQNREDPAAHLFRSVEGEEPVVIWHKSSPSRVN